MSKKNPREYPAPSIVLELGRILEARLGRLSFIRQVKNRNEWFITDPVFSFVQHGLRKGVTGYRVGYFYSLDEDLIAFYLVHAPVMAQLFKKNLNVLTLIKVIKATSQFRVRSFLLWSSQAALKEGKKWAGIDETDFETFQSRIEDVEADGGLVADLFTRPKTQNQNVRVAGNDFFVLLAEPASKLSNDQLMSLVADSWPLFLCLYPIDPIEQRQASLARNLRSAKIPKLCEFSKIRGELTKTNISELCRGPIEGAHIKPHALGGSDKLENGVWLCQYHHRVTEGRLVGKRSGDTFDVEFVSG